MKLTKTIAGAILVIASISTFAMGSSCDTAGAKKDKCHDKAVKHAKTAKGESVCPVTIWAAEAVGPDGKVLDEAVMIWETADGSTWIAKKVKPASKHHNHAHAVKTADGKKVEPMTCADARMDKKNDVKMDIVKSAAPCKEKGSAKCDAVEHTKSINGKAVVCSSADKKNADKKLTAEAKNNVANDGYFLVIEED
ncbi:MAG: hypothetical protein IKB77_05465 [Lentisphaeria bacterium]|nr:hypothetical protein [Lentisphaeria bacterium]